MTHVVELGDATTPMDAVEVLAWIERLELTMATLTVNERINVLAYTMCAFVIAGNPPSARRACIDAIGTGMRDVFLPTLAPTLDSLGIGDYATGGAPS